MFGPWRAGRRLPGTRAGSGGRDSACSHYRTRGCGRQGQGCATATREVHRGAAKDAAGGCRIASLAGRLAAAGQRENRPKAMMHCAIRAGESDPSAERSRALMVRLCRVDVRLQRRSDLKSVIQSCERLSSARRQTTRTTEAVVRVHVRRQARKKSPASGTRGLKYDPAIPTFALLVLSSALKA